MQGNGFSFFSTCKPGFCLLSVDNRWKTPFWPKVLKIAKPPLQEALPVIYLMSDYLLRDSLFVVLLSPFWIFTI